MKTNYKLKTKDINGYEKEFEANTLRELYLLALISVCTTHSIKFTVEEDKDLIPFPKEKPTTIE